MFQLNDNLSSDTLLCADYELAAHPVNAFLHADQTKPVMLFLRIKTTPVVHNSELNLICTNAQRRLEVPGVCMFDGVGKSLLGDAKQTLFVIGWHGSLIAFCLEFRIEVYAFCHALEQISQSQK